MKTYGIDYNDKPVRLVALTILVCIFVIAWSIVTTRPHEEELNIDWDFTAHGPVDIKDN